MKRKVDQVKHTRAKKLLFNTLLITIPLFIFFLLEMLLRIINYGDNFNLFIDFPEKDFREYRFINPLIGKKYFQKLDYNSPCGDMFLKNKPENGFRIFVLGSSTVLGFPYDQNLMFSRILEERLQDNFPDKKIEVINTAITAINSFTLLDFIDDILKEDPDVVLIYAGHNEFYGALGVGSVERVYKSRYLTLLHLNLLSSRLYQLLRNSIFGIERFFSGSKTEEDMRGTLMKVIVENKEICYKSEVYNLAIEYYRKNLEKLLHRTKRANVPVFISELVSNVKDLQPFCSVSATAYPPASEMYSRAKESEQKGDYTNAKKYYYLAKDLDCIRFRASEEINDIIHDLAERFNAHLVPMKTQYFEIKSPNGLIGNNLITEHVHPNIDGYFLMADAFFNSLTGSKLFGNINEVYYENSDYYKKNWGYTQLDSIVGQYKIKNLMSYWPFQPIDNPSHFLENYKPNSFLDSVAITLVKPPIQRIDEAHMKLAGLYYNQSDFYNAFREYYAALMYDPFQLQYYQNAIDCLIKTNDFNLALKLINKSIELKETFYAYFVKSDILFLKRDYIGAIESLNKASKLDKSPEARLNILLKMHKVYHYNHNENKSKEILAELKKINPGIQPNYQDELKDYVYFIPIQVEKQIQKALTYYRTQNFDLALEEFLKSLEIKETALANRCVGDILFVKNDSNSMLYYQKAYPDYQKNPGFLFNLGILYLQNNLPDKAKLILEEIKAIDPGYPKIKLLEESINKHNL
jgi:tetratricopeptide (TPR) repeat protein